MIERALRVSDECDLLLAVGSTLSVYPAANCVPIAKRAGAEVIIVNGQPTEMDRFADYLLTGMIADVLPALLRRDLRRSSRYRAPLDPSG